MTEVIFLWCLWFVAFTEVACWTVDLDDVREFLDKQMEQEDYRHSHYQNYYDESEEYGSFSEVAQSQAQRTHNYAQQFGYDGYMEKKVHGYKHKGAQYLDGLRMALENYKELMENCSVYNFSEFDNLNASLLPDVRWNETSDVWNWNWAQGERKLEWPQLLNVTDPKSAPLRLPSGGILVTRPRVTSVTTPDSPPGEPMDAPSDAPLDFLPDSVPGGPMGDPPGAEMGVPPGARPGPAPGAPLRAPQRVTTGVPPNATPLPTRRATHFHLSSDQFLRAKCQKATREREHVRRLADLALFTARQLQNWATHEKLHDKSSTHAREERALITRLAYFLDKLAELTGYTPDIKVFSKQADRTTTTTPNPLSVPLSAELRQMLLSCLNQKATTAATPATERCRAPLLLPPTFMKMLNITQASTTPTSPPLSSALTTTPPPMPLQPDLRQARVLDNYFLSNAWAQQPARTKRKRSLNEPLMKMVQYYTKHKAWTGANVDIEKHQQLNVENHLKPKTEDRSDFFKRKFVFSFLYPYKNNRIFRRPIIPDNHGDKLNKYLEKLRKSDASSDLVRKLILPRKKSIRKRSIIIKESEDPMRDISYYVKNKPGTNVRPSLADAVRVRASLERIFATGNIEVVWRYGANYNPLIQSPFFFGIIKTLSDI